MFSKNSILTASAAVLSVASAEQWVLDSSTQAQQIVGVGAWSQGNDVGGKSLFFFFTGSVSVLSVICDGIVELVYALLK